MYVGDARIQSKVNGALPTNGANKDKRGDLYNDIAWEMCVPCITANFIDASGVNGTATSYGLTVNNAASNASRIETVTRVHQSRSPTFVRRVARGVRLIGATRLLPSPQFANIKGRFYLLLIHFTSSNPFESAKAHYDSSQSSALVGSVASSVLTTTSSCCRVQMLHKQTLSSPHNATSDASWYPESRPGATGVITADSVAVTATPVTDAFSLPTLCAATR
ncbi:hypothetical protein V500_04944 [Pseudogymnoascus sp. VKM F-4518 (FW-2643)]|nr:hypothetical protein V500_04944 [Pseudogymnoascus sp. VKM F-4518 (FW-2643)]